MRVKIIKASEDTFWYAKHIGEIFEVHQKMNRHGEYVLIEGVGGSTFEIGAEDCEVITE
jgi:hypothetical protein